MGFEHLGSLVPLARRWGYRIRYLEVGVDPLEDVDPDAPELLVVLGGPIGVNDEKDYPFLRAELALVEARLAGDGPVLGICLGAQLIARALGARVRSGPSKEIGWGPVTLTDAGRASCLEPLGGGQPVLHWHGDGFDLPEGATLLASTPAFPNQAFSRRNALALQFHVEAVPQEIERWLIGHAAEIAATPGISVKAIRADTARHGAGLEAAAAEIFRAWFDEVGL